MKKLFLTILLLSIFIIGCSNRGESVNQDIENYQVGMKFNFKNDGTMKLIYSSKEGNVYQLSTIIGNAWLNTHIYINTDTNDIITVFSRE